MVKIEDCKTLEERMFYLGSSCEPLPKEPEPINREYYNLGLEVYSKVQDMRAYTPLIDLATKNINKSSRNKNLVNTMKKFVDNIYNNTITTNYNDICSMMSVESAPLIAGSKVAEHIKSWVDMNYGLINKLHLAQFNEAYAVAKNPMRKNIIELMKIVF